MESSALPGGLDRGIDLDLEGRRRHPVLRRLILTAFTLFVLAALWGVFGQQAQTATTIGADGTRLSIEAPERLRGGLIFQSRFTITAGTAAIGQLRLSLDSGWFDSVTLNAISPEPIAQAGDEESISWHFDRLPAGETMTVWAEWQVNPTRVGRADAGATLFDGALPLAEIDRKVIYFP